MSTRQITKLSLMVATSCNLQCEYCEIHKSKVHSDPKELEKLVVNTNSALDNGLFLHNVVEVFQHNNLDIAAIEEMDLWGQEPTVSLEHFTNHVDDWFGTFFNCKRLFFSTNGMAYTDKIYDLAKHIDDTIDRPFTLALQFSYDGEYSTENSRKANGTKIQDNLIYLINKLSKTLFKHITIQISFHGVLTVELIHQLDCYDKVYSYYKQLDDYIKYIFDNITLPPFINFNKYYALSLNQQAPYLASTQDGLALSRFLKLSRLVDFSSFFTEDAMLLENLNTFRVVRDTLKSNNRCTLTELLEKVWQGDFVDKPRDPIRSMYCGANVGVIKLMYDGTIINCQNNIFSTNDKIIGDNGDIASYSRIHTLKRLFMDKSNEDMHKSIFEIYNLTEHVLYHYISIVMTMIKELAECGQVDKDYLTNNDKLMRDATIIAMANVCGNDLIIYCGSLFLPHLGRIKMWCNGYLDVVYDILTNYEPKYTRNLKR